MKFIPFVCVLLLVLFSGCLDVITTRQKQLCISATDFSKTSIPDCNGFVSCFKKINNSNFVISEVVPFETKNKILTYKNNVASAVYYFNEAEKEIQKIHSYCSGEKDLKIIEISNNLMFYISRIFNYQDLAWQKSIEILKDYAIYLKSQGVEQITEEEIYDAFVLINKNINELRDEGTNNNTYVGLLKIEAKNARELASDFGFLKSYMTNVNYIDIYAYYSEYVENPEQELKIPVISKSSNYVFSKLSGFENFRRINENMKRTDSYNLYILFDKHIGINDSLFNRFVLLNNKINTDINDVYLKIKNLEEEIEKSKDALDLETIEEYKEQKQEFVSGRLGFGYYLAKLKEIKQELENAENINIKISENQDIELENCKVLILQAKNYNNQYFKELIYLFETEVDVFKRISACKSLKDKLSYSDCLNDLEMLISEDLLKYTEINSNEECIDLISQLNYNLSKTEKLELYFDILNKSKVLLNNLKVRVTSFEDKIKLSKCADSLDALENLQNFEIYLNKNNELENLNKIYLELEKYWTESIKKQISETKEIIFENGTYYLKLTNFGNQVLKGVCIDNDYLDIESIDQKLEIKASQICVSEMSPGENLFKINYKNERSIKTRFINITLDKSLLETLVKNTSVGFIDTLNLGQPDIEFVDNINYKLNSAGEIEYVTKLENKILYYLTALEKTHISASATQINEQLISIKENFKITNKYVADFCGDVVLMECKRCVAQLWVNDKETEIDYYAEPEKISANLCFEKNGGKILELHYLTNKTAIQDLVDEFIIRIGALMNSEFKEISLEAKKEFKEIFEKFSSNDAPELTEMLNIINLEEKIKLLEKQNTKKAKALENTKALISKILDYNLSKEEEKKLEEIEKLCFSDPEKANALAINLLEEITQKENGTQQLVVGTYTDKLNKLQKKANEYNIMDELLQTKFLDASKSPDSNKITQLEKTVDEAIQEKAKFAYTWISYFKELDKSKLKEIVLDIEWIYVDIEIKDLYAVKYYPKITLDDVERLKKKQSFLETIKFKESTSNYLYEYDGKNYASALDAIDYTNIERLIDLNKEIELVVSGLNQIKKDANTEITKVVNSKLTKNTTVLENIKKNYENKRYLKVIMDSRIALVAFYETKTANYSGLTLYGGGAIAIFLGVLVFFNKKPKKPSKEEKKQKILRHY